MYSFGALAYCVLTGKHAYHVTQLDQLSDAWKRPVVRPKQLVREIPDALDELIMSLMSLDPMQRPKSAAEVIDWLSAIGQLPADDASAVARSFLTGSRLCGRDTERKQLTRRLQRALDGRGSAALIEGPVGSGKSRLLSEAALIGQTLGFVVVRAIARRQRGAEHSVAQDMLASLRQIAPIEAEAAGAKRIEWPVSRDGRVSTRPKSVQANDAGEVRGRLQAALTDVFCKVAAERPLLIAVDDLEKADEFSTAFITALAHQTQSVSLVVIASETEGRTDLHFQAAISLRSVASHMQLTDLDRTETSELVESLFGPVPNIDRLSDWLFRVAYGNPKLTIELAEHLMERGIIRYVEGTWVLPSDEITEAVPHDVIEALAMRVQGLSAPALELAELLSVRRGGASAEVCLAANGGEPEKVFGALDELVRRGVLESAGHDYVFAQDALRKTLEGSLPIARSRALHRRWVDVLLHDETADIDAQLEAGWHLVHTEDELEGADLLASVGPRLFDQGLSMSTAIPAIEKALAVYERFGRPLQARLRLRSVLVLAGFLYDYRLAWRYGEETLAMLREVSGFNLAARFSRVLGARLGLLLAVTLISIRRPWIPAARRGPPIVLALKYLVRTAMGLIGVRAVALDAPGTSAILEALQPLAAAPAFTSGPLIYLACRALALQQLGREGELDHALREALQVLRRGRKRDMTEMEYRNLYVGLLMSDGVNECHRENSQALARADQLDGIGLRLAFAAAARIRMIY
ncbi:MAG TPA: AAA family ATPase, partial [Polyangiales bacterium]